MYYNDKQLKDYQNIAKDILEDPNYMSIILEFKTKDGKLYYLQNKRKIHDEKCVLLTFGFIKKLEKDYNYNAPIAIKSIIKKYVNKNDIDFNALTC